MKIITVGEKSMDVCSNVMYCCSRSAAVPTNAPFSRTGQVAKGAGCIPCCLFVAGAYEADALCLRSTGQLRDGDADDAKDGAHPGCLEGTGSDGVAVVASWTWWYLEVKYTLKDNVGTCVYTSWTCVRWRYTPTNETQQQTQQSSRWPTVKGGRGGEWSSAHPQWGPSPVLHSLQVLLWVRGPPCRPWSQSVRPSCAAGSCRWRSWGACR